MSRDRRLKDSFDLVIRTMNLRPPQADALAALRDVVLRLPAPLSECSREQAREFLTMEERHWSHPFHPTFTIDLATGVGKTRLTGAIIAMLWLAGEAGTFLILAPRRAVLRRFESALDPRFREYLFVDQNLIPEPTVIRADEVETPKATGSDPELFAQGPLIYLLSPQLVTSSDRFNTRAEYAELSPADALRKTDDLVVIADEAHHIGKLAEQETTAWAKAIRSLRPRLQLGLTATRRDEAGVNVLFEYPLRKALAEGFYTKTVRVLVRSFDERWGDENDIDRATVDFALERLKIKVDALRRVQTDGSSPTKPVAVLFARDTEHAEELYRWLIDTGRLDKQDVLITHSRMAKSEADIERLLSVENAANPVRVIVNVMELTEGWDVTNVYVIAPLRAMATFQGALQAMGRGLRLPFGRRLGDREVDALDVVCFGKANLEEIIEEATTWSGRDPINTDGLRISQAGSPDSTEVSVLVPSRRDAKLSLEELRVAHHEISLNLQPEALRQLTAAVVHGMELAAARIRVGEVEGHVRLSRARFVAAASMRVLRNLPRYLSDDRHESIVGDIVTRWLDRERPGVDLIDFDPAEVGEEIARLLAQGAQRQAPEYQETGSRTTIEFPEFRVNFELPSPLPGQAMPSASIEDFPVGSVRDFVRGRPYRGWENSLHPAYTFESPQEYKVAKMLDVAEGVDWWVRNQPRRLRIPTPAGDFHPDFVVCEVTSAPRKKESFLLLEVKGDTFWDGPESPPRLKAAAAQEWCLAQSLSGTNLWRAGIALESVVNSEESWVQLSRRLTSATP